MDGGGSDDCGGLKNRGEHWDKPEEEGGGVSVGMSPT